MAGGQRAVEEPTVADLLQAGAGQTAEFEATGGAVLALPVPQVMGQYDAALAVTRAPATRRGIERRLAGLDLQRSEQALSELTPGQSVFDGPILRYRALLANDMEKSAAGADSDQLFYQLARAYDMAGQTEQTLAALDRLVSEYPGSPYYAESQFRRGEILFSQQRYAAAQSAYAQVVASGKGSAFYRNAIYLYGWSQFKQAAYVRSLDAFGEIMAAMVPGDGELDSLSRADREMVLDTLRVMSLVFSYEGGAETIDLLFSKPDESRYLPLFYSSLADLYLTQQHFSEAAQVYAHFIARNPAAPQAPDFTVRMIDAYAQGGFADSTVAAKRQFVQGYGVTSGYWRQSDGAMRGHLRPQLRDYLEQLARYEHARGLAFKAAGQPTRADDSLMRAARAYEQFVETVPNDERVAEMTFLQGEVLFEAGEYESAISAYTWVAYQRRDEARGAEAGYAGSRAYDALLGSFAAGPAEADAALISAVHDDKIANVLRFADAYPDHPQVTAVLLQGASQLLQRRQYDEAAVLATLVTDSGNSSRSLHRTAWLVRGQAAFEQARYREAEFAYAEALSLIPVSAQRDDEVADRLAASIYRQGEAALQAGERRVAIDHFLRVAAVAPGSSFAAQGQYDAAAHLIDSQAWAEAEQVLTLLRARYPTHPVAQDLASQLSEVYLRQSKWPLAAAELSDMAERASEPEQRRQSLYRAAELYRNSGLTEQSITHFRRYVERYPAPFDDSVEARLQLAQLYQQIAQADQRGYWLGQLIAVHDKADARTTPRSLYLAAQAATELAGVHYEVFQNMPLVQPLRASLQAKQQSLNVTLQAYDKVLDYQVAPFFSLASYRIADVYASLGRDLMASQRPTSLDALEMEQYELLLEEQAYPFEEQAIAIHESNARRAAQGVYDTWVRSSFSALADLVPARYDKVEKTVSYSNEIH